MQLKPCQARAKTANSTSSLESSGRIDKKPGQSSVHKRNFTGWLAACVCRVTGMAEAHYLLQPALGNFATFSSPVHVSPSTAPRYAVLAARASTTSRRAHKRVQAGVLWLEKKGPVLLSLRVQQIPIQSVHWMYIDARITDSVR